MSYSWQTDRTPQTVRVHEDGERGRFRSTRKIWRWVAIAMLAVIGVGCIALKPLTLMLQAKVYADRVMTTSFAAWDAAAMTNELDPTAVGEENGETRRRFEAWSRQLGPLRSHRVTGTHANMNFGRPTTSRVTIEADFERAPATIGLELVQAGRAWRIANWAIHSHVADPLAWPGVIWSDTFDDPTSDGCADTYNGPEGVIECSGGELWLARLDMRPILYMLRRLGRATSTRSWRSTLGWRDGAEATRDRDRLPRPGLPSRGELPVHHRARRRNGGAASYAGRR